MNTKILYILFAAMAASLWGTQAVYANALVFSEDDREHKKIAYLIDSIDSSGATFIRNGKEYDASRASEHVVYKVGKANGRIKTARQFIHYVASRSFLSGKPYYMRTPDGEKVTARQWLFERLYEYENNQGDVFFREPAEHNS